MLGRIALALCASLVAGAAGAGGGLYRCEAADGSLRFADSRHACRGAAPRELPRGIQRVPPAAPAAPPEVAPQRDLGALLLDAAELGDGWELVREAPVDPSRDPDLVEWGVVAQRARHYTRDRAGTAEVCSLELWSFRTREQARAADAGFAFPGWQIERQGEILLMVRGLRRPPHGGAERGVFADCESLARRVRARLAAGR